MSEPGTAVAAPHAEPPVRAMEALMSDDEIRRAYRIAEALYVSGAYKDVRKAETAFAKIVIGRDLGLSPAQAMGGIHLVEGGVQMHYAMLGQFVRARSGYDYRPGWIKEGPDGPEVVWHDEEDPADMRPINGAVVEFTVDGKRRGVSRFTLDDARSANLIKDSSKAAWNTSPRNMLLARALSNGVKWFVPETLGGLPVYVEGELDTRDQKSLTAAPDDDEEEKLGIDLGPGVVKMMERATKLGHRGLSNRLAVEAAVGQRSPGVIKEWLERAHAELDDFEKKKAEAAAADGEQPEEAPVEAPPEEVTAAPEDVQQPEETPAEDDPHERIAGEVQVEEAPDA